MADRKSDERSQERRVQVLHDRVGTHSRGQVVPLSEFEDSERLFKLGAIGEIDEESVSRPPTLHEAMHSESPPTLPNAPFVDASEEDVQRAAGLLPPQEGTNVAPGSPTYVGPEQLRATPVPPMGHDSPITQNPTAQPKETSRESRESRESRKD